MKFSIFLALSGLLLLAGCEREDIRTYTIPKEQQSERRPAVVPQAPETGPMRDMANTAVPTAQADGLQWQAPAHWLAGPDAPMRKATWFTAPQDGPTVEISITAFPGDVGGPLANVNRWRGQVGLSPEASLAEVGMTHLDLPIGHVDTVLLEGPQGQGILAAIIPIGNATWFVKASGPNELLHAEQEHFQMFLGTWKQTE